MSPRQGTPERKKACHVCSRRRSVGVWRDQHGNKLLACGTHACITGYKLERKHPEVTR